MARNSRKKNSGGKRKRKLGRMIRFRNPGTQYNTQIQVFKECNYSAPHPKNLIDLT